MNSSTNEVSLPLSLLSYPVRYMYTLLHTWRNIVLMDHPLADGDILPILLDEFAVSVVIIAAATLEVKCLVLSWYSTLTLRG